MCLPKVYLSRHAVASSRPFDQVLSSLDTHHPEMLISSRHDSLPSLDMTAYQVALPPPHHSEATSRTAYADQQCGRERVLRNIAAPTVVALSVSLHLLDKTMGLS